MRCSLIVGLTCLISVSTGCHGPNLKKEPFGKIYYLDGAGNWGFGCADVPRGFEQAGYRGDVEIYGWSMTLNPLLDQLNLFGSAEAAGRRLARKIEDYKLRYPQNTVNIVALSAGTGVAVWACESLPKAVSIDHLVLLGSSLSADYDMDKALTSVKRVHVYHSPHNAVLASVEIFGTIDRKLGAKSAGQVGLRQASGRHHKIVNTPWSRKWSRLGWSGGHTDCTNARFVQNEIAPYIMAASSSVQLVSAEGDARRTATRAPEDL